MGLKIVSKGACPLQTCTRGLVTSKAPASNALLIIATQPPGLHPPVGEASITVRCSVASTNAEKCPPKITTWAEPKATMAESCAASRAVIGNHLESR